MRIRKAKKKHSNKKNNTNAGYGNKQHILTHIHNNNMNRFQTLDLFVFEKMISFRYLLLFVVLSTSILLWFFFVTWFYISNICKTMVLPLQTAQKMNREEYNSNNKIKKQRKKKNCSLHIFLNKMADSSILTYTCSHRTMSRSVIKIEQPEQ